MKGLSTIVQSFSTAGSFSFNVPGIATRHFIRSLEEGHVRTHIIFSIIIVVISSIVLPDHNKVRSQVVKEPHVMGNSCTGVVPNTSALEQQERNKIKNQRQLARSMDSS